MFTPATYFGKIGQVDFSTLPEAFRKSHDFVVKATNGGKNWDSYHSNAGIKKMIDLYFHQLSEKLHGGVTQKAAPTKTKVQHKANPASEKRVRTKSSPARPGPEHQPAMVSRMPDELRFIRRFVALNGKTKTKDELLRFINSLQKAIVEKRIRKTSQWAEQIRYIQDVLIKTYNSMASKVKIELKEETFEKMKQFGNSEKVLVSVGFIKRYISMNEKPGMKEKAKALLAQINRASESGKIGNGDPYYQDIQEISKNIEAFLSDKGIKVLEIETNELNGLQGILNGCACESVNGLGNLPAGRPQIMNSMDFAQMQFRTLGFTGKWRDFIGDPTSNFTAMVFGKPKFGKSNLCVDFAGYLARNHGNVLYVAKEEGLDKTLQDKLNDRAVKHPSLDVSSFLPSSLGGYDFIFLDSVTRLGLDPDALTRLKVLNPSKSFIYIFQSTKEGNFRGANSFQHDVDVVIEVPEFGKAVQYGRFNQGGEMAVFNK